MILTIKGADFSAANIGTLSTYVVSKSIGAGAEYNIPSFVAKHSSINWVITLNQDYIFGTYVITMGGEMVTPTINDNVMTITIPNVTGNIRISIATIYNKVEDLPTPSLYTLTINPNPSDARVVLSADGYNQIGNSITVAEGTSVSYEVSLDGYFQQNSSIIVNSNSTIDVTLTRMPGGGEVDESAIVWYVDNSGQNGKNFDYTTNFPGATIIVEDKAEALRNVPINVIKFMPGTIKGAAGKFAFAKLTPGTEPSTSDIYYIDIPTEDAYATAPSNDAEARTYILNTPITLNENEYLLMNYLNGTERTVGFWVNSGGQSDYKVGTYDRNNYTLKTENWGWPFSIGYLA